MAAEAQERGKSVVRAGASTDVGEPSGLRHKAAGVACGQSHLRQQVPALVVVGYAMPDVEAALEDLQKTTWTRRAARDRHEHKQFAGRLQ